MFVKAVSKLIQILWGKNGIQVVYLSPAPTWPFRSTNWEKKKKKETIKK